MHTFCVCSYNCCCCYCGLATSLSRGKKLETETMRERLAILGMLINIHEQSSLASIFKNYGVVVNCFIEALVCHCQKHRRASLCCIIVLSKHMIGYWFFVKGCRLDRILSSQRSRLPGIASLSRFYSFSRFCSERDL